MNPKYQSLWNKAVPLLKKPVRKDFVLHTQMVSMAMEALLVSEGGDQDTLMTAAILHDVGWSEVPNQLQLATDRENSLEALKQHINRAPPIIAKILAELHYEPEMIQRITDIIVAHKFTNPTEKEKQLLIDADTLSDTYKEAFWSDVKSYGKTPKELWQFRSKNTFYTKTAQEIFDHELNLRLNEISAQT